MRSSISTYKESLSRIANEVFVDDDDDLAVPSPSNAAAASPLPLDSRRFSRRQSRMSSSPSSSASPMDSGPHDEIARYKADILKLQASEAEIKALSYNYAAMLTEKEEELSKLREENGSLKKNLETTVGNGSRDESRKVSSFPNVMKSTADQSPPSRRQRSTYQENSHSAGSNTQKSNSSKSDGYSNGRTKEYPDFEDNRVHLAALQTKYETEIKELKSQLENEREYLRTLKQKLQDEHQNFDACQREVRDITNDKQKISIEMEGLLKDLDRKTREIVQLQAELRTQKAVEKSGQSLDTLKDTIRTLEKENARLKVEKDDLSEKLRVCSTSTSEDLQKVTEEMTYSTRKLEEMLKEACKERDKAKQEVARLKQHLLDKELEDSDKMDEDNKLIEQLRVTCDHQRAQMLQLEKALKQEIAKREESRKLNDEELRASTETVRDLQQKLKNCMAVVDSKNDELLNLQSALGQYYAEVEAKERLGRELALAREESAKLAESLKAVNKELELAKKEKEEISTKIIHADRMLSDGKHSIQKFEEENSKLRRALEQNMTRLNRMSLDSDNYVDRRIVIKLLVTYFQRNHSKEVLDLMVRMLGFSEEDKQRIGFAHQTAGKGVVRGVLGLPGRLVGGILGGSSPETASHFDSDNQSFADLWVDFLLKEGEERERRESSEVAKVSSSTDENNTTAAMVPKLSNDSVQSQVSSSSRVPTVNISADQRSASLPSKKYGHFEHSDTEFSTVPLTSDNSSDRSYSHRLPPRY